VILRSRDGWHGSIQHAPQFKVSGATVFYKLDNHLLFGLGLPSAALFYQRALFPDFKTTIERNTSLTELTCPNSRASQAAALM
jgi:hypothetical protein